MDEPRVSFMTKLSGILPTIEKILLGGAAVGLIMKYQGLPGDEILKISLSGLAGIYYLMGFMKPPQTEEAAATEEKKRGFLELLFSTIAPKVAWLSCSVSTIGVLFTLLNLAGSREMLMIGGSAAGLATLLIAVGLAQGNEKVKTISQVLYRLVPLLGISAYYLMQ